MEYLKIFNPQTLGSQFWFWWQISHFVCSVFQIEFKRKILFHQL